MYTLSDFVYLINFNGQHRLFIGPKASISLSDFVYLINVNGKHRLFIGSKARISLICIVCKIGFTKEDNGKHVSYERY